MADERGRSDGQKRTGGAGRSGGAPRKGGDARKGGAGQRSEGRYDRDSRDGKPGRDGKPTREGKPGRDGKPSSRTSGPRTSSSGGRSSDRPFSRQRDDARPRTQEERSAEQAIYDGPELPVEVTGAELSTQVRAQLKSLPEKLALRVARHLAAAGQLIDEDPEVAYQHTLAARARASRIAVVREAVGETAYAAGHYAEALAELRAAKRMNGATAYLPIMADCHRALGQPQKALELAKSPSVMKFEAPAKAEMTIVEAGARRDLGQLDAALRTLEVAPLNHNSRDDWVVRLRYAYADTLEAADRLNDALTWFHKTNAIDNEELTDAAERAEALEKRIERD